jgi:hypothetical protein
MKVKLIDIPAYYINLESDKDRNDKTYSLLSSLNFRIIKRTPGFKNKRHAVGVGMAHQNVLDSRKHYDTPFIVFEDDIAVTHFDHIIDIPEDADAIYLGVSKMGVINNEHKELIIADKVNGYDNVYRIYNMLAAHAILYLNQDYVAGLAEETKRCLDAKIPVDIGMANYMKDRKVYALDKPMFIQSGKFRDFTDTPIYKLNNLMPNSN